jgi:DNA-binding MarR family transcriptional regulator
VTQTATARRSAQPEPEFRLEAHLFYHISQVLAVRNRALNAELRGSGLDYSRWRVLAVLQEHPGCSMLQLAERTSVDRTSLAHTVRVMEREGLVSRVAREADRRSVVLTLSPLGRRKYQAILPAVLAQNTRALAGFSEADVDRLRRQLKRIVGNLKAAQVA